MLLDQLVHFAVDVGLAQNAEMVIGQPVDEIAGDLDATLLMNGRRFSAAVSAALMFGQPSWRRSTVVGEVDDAPFRCRDAGPASPWSSASQRVLRLACRAQSQLAVRWIGRTGAPTVGHTSVALSRPFVIAGFAVMVPDPKWPL